MNAVSLAFALADDLGIGLELNKDTGKLTGDGSLVLKTGKFKVPYSVSFSYVNVEVKAAGIVLHMGEDLYLAMARLGVTVGFMVIDGSKLSSVPARESSDFRNPKMKAKTFFGKVSKGIVYAAILNGENWVETKDIDKFQIRLT